jgi:hypothetical protein
MRGWPPVFALSFGLDVAVLIDGVLLINSRGALSSW